MMEYDELEDLELEDLELDVGKVCLVVLFLCAIVGVIVFGALHSAKPKYSTQIHIDGVVAERSVHDCEYGVAYNFSQIAMWDTNGEPLRCTTERVCVKNCK